MYGRQQALPLDWAPYRYGHWVLCFAVGMDLGGTGTVGFCAVPLRPLGFRRKQMVLDAGAGCGQAGLFAGAGGIRRRRRRVSVIGVGVGVGWFPLGPGEVFVPWYRTSPRYVQNVNITNTRVNVVQVTNVYNNVTVNHVNNITYVNQRVTNSVTVVNHDTFVNARPVHDNIVRVDQKQFWSAPVGREAVSNIRPVRQSVMGAGRPAQMRPPEQESAGR